MKRHVNSMGFVRAAALLCASLVALAPQISVAQGNRSSETASGAAQSAQHQAKLQQILQNRSSYVASIVRRWQTTPTAKGRWNANDAADLTAALMRLQPEALLAAGDAPTYEAMTNVLAAGPVLPQALGDTSGDLVYTPVNPCRIVDTRIAGGRIAVGTPRNFDVDGASFTGQGGFNGSCGIPFGVARAVAMTITATLATGNGRFVAFSFTASEPDATTLYFNSGQNNTSTTIVRVAPGSGSDFTVAAKTADAHAIIDVVGYFAAPVATALDCTNVASSTVSVPVNVWTSVDAFCPFGRTATGGGYFVNEGTLGYPGVWITSVPLSNGWRTWVDNQTNGGRNVQTWARCCRVPGR